MEVGEGAAGREDLLLLVVASFDRDLRLPQDRQAGRIGLGRRRVVSESEERAAHAEGARAGIAEVELQPGQRFDVGVLGSERERNQRANDRRENESAHDVRPPKLESSKDSSESGQWSVVRKGDLASP